jgi:hypothetical protein
VIGARREHGQRTEKNRKLSQASASAIPSIAAAAHELASMTE